MRVRVRTPRFAGASGMPRLEGTEIIRSRVARPIGRPVIAVEHLGDLGMKERLGQRHIGQQVMPKEDDVLGYAFSANRL